MNDAEYIRKGVELADGWKHINDTYATCPLGPNAPLPVYSTTAPKEVIAVGLDAIAAQLMRQVDELSEFAVHIEPGKTIICRVEYTEKNYPIHFTRHVEEGTDRTMNMLRAIIDSKVLEQ